MKPILKWVGGKTQILNDILTRFPKSIQNYYEPFLGGGSVLLGVLSKIRDGNLSICGQIYASDLNPTLIGLYKNIQSRPHEVIQALKLLNINEEDYYYSIRNQFNSLKDKSSIDASAMFIYLNKTCFRGLYREGPSGFNVPFGHYKNPKILDEDHILAVSELIQPVIFMLGSFCDTLQSVSAKDFVYLDPPYAPETSTSFVGYNAVGFGLDTHDRLFKMCKDMHQKGALFLMSNADVSLVKNAFQEESYIIDTISCRRAIHSKDPSKVTNEVLITNKSMH